MTSLSQFFNTISSRHSDILQATFQHLSISLYALLIAVVIAVPAAIWSTRHKRVASALLQVTGVFQTIPSLALLGILIPIVGIGIVPTIVALVVYALLPIFQNSYVGLTEIDPALLEAADAFGMSRWKKLTKLEIPVALPVIVSGIRTALVFIIGTATLAALIGAGGLGNFILLGIDQNNVNLILIGAIGAALLAIILTSLISFLQKRRPRVAILSLAALLVAVTGVNVGQSNLFASTPKQTITIAGKLGAEPDILINMYADIIEQADPNVNVVVKPNFGNTSFLFNALKANSIDIYPEYTGTITGSLVTLSASLKGKSLSETQTYSEAKSLISQQFGMTYLEPTQFEDTYALAVTKAYAAAHGLTTMSDLAKVANTAKAAFDIEFSNRADGYLGVKSLYGVSFATVMNMDESLAYQAIQGGKVDVIDVYSTDSGITRYGLVTLEDNLHLFPAYQAAPLMKTSFANKNPKVVAALGALAGKVTTKDIQQMNYEVDVQGANAATIAKNYLVSHGLLAK